MDNQKYSSVEKINTEKLFDRLLISTEASLVELSNVLKLDRKNILALISRLRDMGLDISQKSNNIKLITKIKAIDINLIKTKIINAQINKPVNYYFSTSSTNKLAKEDQKIAIYISEHQSAGKGRQAKQWITPLAQSIAISITHDFNFGLNKLSGLNIAIGVAIINTVKKYGYTHLGLKWPNDILGQDGKVAGILIEATGNKNSSRVIIGIGINWQVRQTLLNSIEQNCMNIGIDNCSRTEFIASLIIAVEEILVEFSQNKLKKISTIWQQYDALSEQTINIITGNKIQPANYIGIDEHGLLRVKIDQQIITLASGEVSIRPIA